MRRLFCRSLRLELVAALGMALVVPALAAQSTQAAGLKSTATTLSAGTGVQGSHAQSAVTVAVTGEDGLPATGSVVIEEDGRQLAGVALSAEGRASLEMSLPAGEHNLTAVYGGDKAHQASTSKVAGVRAQAAASTTPDFAVSVAPASISLTAGQSSTSIGVPIIVSITPVNASALTAPMFVTLSCSGYPDQSTCTFTPENVEILPNATAATLSSMVITTQATSLADGRQPSGSSPVAWAVLVPGILGLGGLAFSVRRHRWLNRLSLVALLGFVSILGATACAPRYNYYNHGPPYNLPTPSGSYTLTLAAQSSNGISATTHFTTFALTVK